LSAEYEDLQPIVELARAMHSALAEPVQGHGREKMIKRLTLVLFGAVVAASLLLPVVTEAGNLNPNDTLVRDAD
jgi:hypothetical protein